MFLVASLTDSSALWATHQVMVMSHAAGHSDGHEPRVWQMFLDNLKRWMDSGPRRLYVT